MEGLGKTMNYLRQYIRFPDRDLNPRPLVYEAGVPTTRQRCSAALSYETHSVLSSKYETASDSHTKQMTSIKEWFKQYELWFFRAMGFLN
jgi:hypothetical protein